jgi:hypothetical protein
VLQRSVSGGNSARDKRKWSNIQTERARVSSDARFGAWFFFPSQNTTSVSFYLTFGSSKLN